MLEETEGDLIQLAKAGRFDVIAHGCNCFCDFGAGIALAIKRVFPATYEADLATEEGDRSKLGTCTEAQVGDLTVINAYTQFHWKGKGVLVDYEALRACMQWICQHHGGKRIGLPKIGTGYARGDWTLIRRIIEEELGDEDVTLVTLTSHK